MSGSRIRCRRRFVPLWLFGLVLALGTGSAAAQFANQIVDVGGEPQEVVIVDLNGDGLLDMVVVNQATDDLSILAGEDGTFGAETRLAVGDGPRAVVTADFDEDGHPDLAVGNTLNCGEQCEVWVLPGNGDGTFGTESRFRVGPRPSSMAVADFDDDGHEDLVTVNSGHRSRWVALGTPLTC